MASNRLNSSLIPILYPLRMPWIFLAQSEKHTFELSSFETRKLRLRMTKVDKNFLARTEKKIEKLIWVDWISLQVRFNVVLWANVM
jgi:hypothetical protein